MKRRLIALTVALLALLIGLSSCTFLTDLPNLPDDTDDGGTTVDEIVKAMLEHFSYYDVDISDEDLAYATVSAYIAKTGDRYARYYNEEEYAELVRENEGDTQGIGITVTENSENKLIEIISVLPDTPAERAGLEAGDLIALIGIGDSAESVEELGYEPALKKLQGVKGTLCEFGIKREGSDEVIEFSVLREEFTSESVLYTTSVADKSIGIVKIVQFDLTTPTQFDAAMEALIASGCNKFVYDVRSNPGGDLASITAVLSRFLNSGDIVIRTEDRSGNMETQYCGVVSGYKDGYETCNVTSADIGKYRNYPAAVLVNGGTASAAELFTGNMKDYGLAKIVGTQTYGKGCMQSIYSLGTGAIKMTTAFYYPPLSDNYDGVGISPDEGYVVELSEAAAKINLYKLLRDEYQAQDDQLAAAVAYLTK